MKTLLTLVVGLLLLFLLSLVLAANLGGENVVLLTAGVDGRTHETRVWIQEVDNSEWVRADSPENRWYQRLNRRPLVEMKRRGQWRRYRAIPAPHRNDEINSAMARKYGWADWLIGMVRNRDYAVAIRLEPAGG